VQRFATAADEAAFGTLLRRHGPMALGVCRRVLHNLQDAEDAFQATFLVLARKAGSLRDQQSVGSWLYGVAYRQALNVRAAAARRLAHEGQVRPRTATDPLDEITLREAQEVLDAELSRLADRYRAPLVLCCLEGLTRDEAARQLGLPLGTLKSRLERGRRLLGSRLARRGLTLTAAFSAGLLGQGLAQAEFPTLLARSTLQAALACADNAGAGTLASSQKILLTGTRLRVGAALILTTGILAAGAGLLGFQERSPQRPPDEPAPVVESPVARTDSHGDPLPPGALARMGTIRWRLDAYSAEAMAVPADGKTLVTIHAAKGIVVWDATTGRPLRQIPEDPGLRQEWLGQPSWSISALSADGRKAALIPSNGAIYVVDIATGKAQQSWKNPGGYTERALLSADGKILATRANATIQIWDTESGKLLRELPATRKQDGVWKTEWLAFAGDGKTLAWVGEDGECPIHVVDVASGEERQRLGEHDGGERQIVLSPDGQLLVSTSTRGLVQLWDARKGRILSKWTGRENTPPPMAAFTPDGKNLLLTRGGDAMRLVDVATGKELWRVPRPSSSSIQDAYAFAPDHKKLYMTMGSGPMIFRHDLATGRRLLDPGEQSGSFQEIIFSADERALYTLGADRRLRVWDVATGQERRLTDVGTGLATFAPDGTLLAAVKNKVVRLFETATGQELRQWQLHPGLDFNTVDFSPDGRILAFSGKNIEGAKGYSIVLWDVAVGKELHRVPVPAWVWYLAFTADGRSLVWNSWTTNPKQDSALHSLDVATGRECPPVRLPPNRGLALLSPDGKTIALDQEEPFLRYYEAATQKLRLELRPVNTWPPHVTTSPDQRSILVADGEGGVQIHDAFDGSQVFRVTGPRGNVTSFAFSPSGRLLATASGDGTALVWDAAELLRKGRKTAGKLSEQQVAALWVDLASDDAARAYQAIGRLSASPAEALPWLRDHLQPVAAMPIDEKRLDQLLSELDSNHFEIRERASQEIAQLGEFARPALDRALSRTSSVEVRSRIQQLVEKCAPARSPECLRALRAIELLELIGTAEARRLLDRLARGAAEASLTREARAAQDRLNRHLPAMP
jgi:RNA polymerase sigma factor (sigma-70 family)